MTVASGRLPPGPRLPAWCQSALGLVAAFPLLDRCRRRYGPIFTIRAIGGGTMVIVASPKAAQQIFAGTPDELLAGAAIAFAHPEVGEHSIFVADGERHRRIRRTLVPAFRSAALAGYVATMVEVADAAVARWPRGSAFGVLPHTRQLALEIVVHALFGVRSPDDARPLVDAFLRLLDLLAVPGLVYRAFQHELSPWWRAFVRVRADIRARLGRMLAERRDAGTGMIALLAEEPDNDAAIDQLISMLVAGHETTAISLAWALRAILARPGVVARIRAELASVVGTSTLAAEHLPRLRFLEATILETLRLWPPLPLVVRRLAAPIEAHGYTLPAGVTVAPCSYLIHRDPELWADPHEFAPSRFLDPVPSAAFLPFGGGVRRCLGTSFAMDEMKVVLARVLGEPGLALASVRTSRPHRRWVTLAPRPDVRVRL